MTQGESERVQPADSQLAKAFAAHQKGQLREAELIYESIIQKHPDNVDALQLLGALMIQDDRPKEAIPYLTKVVALCPTYPSFLVNLGTAYSRIGDKERALSYYASALEVDSRFDDALRNSVTVCMKLGRFEDAITHLNSLSNVAPSDSSWRLNLAICLLKTERYEDSIKHFEEYLEEASEDKKALAGLGQALLKVEGREESAAACWRKFIELEPSNAGAHNNLATVLKNLKQFDAAIITCKKSLQLEPDFFPALCNLGIAYAGERSYELAHKTLGDAVLSFEANIQESYIEIAAVAYSQLASTANLLGMHDEAVGHVERSLELDPKNVEARLQKGFLNLQMGHYLEGWPDYEWRLKRKKGTRTLPGPRWSGAEDSQATVLIHVEQGLGDTIMFGRYCALVRQRCFKTILLCHPPLARLMATCPGVDCIIEDGQPLPDYDFQVPLLSLPFIFGTETDSVPADIPYLGSNSELLSHWRGRINARAARLKVGICWQGNPEFSHDHLRSVPLGYFQPLAELPGIELISLQKGEGAAQLKHVSFEVTSFEGLDEESGPFMDTSAIIENCDLVITTDTSLAHLSGALGAKTWLATSFANEWRWFSDGRESTPWYPTMRLFRQPKMYDWESVFVRMKECLRGLA